MGRTRISIFSSTLLATAALVVAAASETVVVTPDNFARAETDMYFAKAVKDGAFGKFTHNRELMPIDNQTVIRSNRDTLYSMAVFDLDAGPVTITLPSAGKRFMSLQIINQDEYVPAVYYGAGAYTLTKAKVGTRYAMAGVRILVDPSEPNDFREVHALQDAIKVRQAHAGSFETPTGIQRARRKCAMGFSRSPRRPKVSSGPSARRRKWIPCGI